ncbi:MAG TPA: ATP-binding protein [Acidimicrobiales bacterium]
MSADVSLDYLRGRLDLVVARIERAVGQRRKADPNSEDPLRGLYLSDEQVMWLADTRPEARLTSWTDEEVAWLEDIETEADKAEADGHVLRLRHVRDAFELQSFEIDLLLVCLSPDVDRRVEQLFGYLNDDVSRRRPSIGLALELSGTSALMAPARACLSPGSKLVDGGLLEIEGLEEPFLSRTLRVPDRVTAFLLGDLQPDATVVPVWRTIEAAPVDARDISRLLWSSGGRSRVYIEERAGSAAYALAASALSEVGLAVLTMDLDLVLDQLSPQRVIEAAGREARLQGAGLVAGPIDTLVERRPQLVRVLTGLACPLLMIGRGRWDPTWSMEVPAQRVAEPLGPTERSQVWRESSGGIQDDAVLNFSLSPEGVSRAVLAARLAAEMEGSILTTAHLVAGARTQNAAGLERQARRIEPSVGWDDLVVRPIVRAQLEELTARAAHRDTVLGQWGLRPGGGRGRGVTGLFAGEPGTGKTMAAEVVAGALGLDLYAVDLSTVVDKYIGETEKHLERIFTEAEGINGLILFDEADALFGKRSEVSDAHDRHANIEVAYLLQRMERFDGLAVLATNMRSNIDEAFARRIDAIIEFPMPDMAERRELWEACLGTRVPRGKDLDLDLCARAFEISGGNIRSIVISASYLAASKSVSLGMELMMRAIEREYRKLGRLVLEREFGVWWEVVHE